MGTRGLRFSSHLPHAAIVVLVGLYVGIAVVLVAEPDAPSPAVPLAVLAVVLGAAVLTVAAVPVAVIELVGDELRYRSMLRRRSVPARRIRALWTTGPVRARQGIISLDGAPDIHVAILTDRAFLRFALHVREVRPGVRLPGLDEHGR